MSCSKDDDNGFDFPMEKLYGKWKAKEVNVNGSWIDVTKYPYTKFGMEITFYEHGKFYGSGYFGSGSGTYKAKGKTVTTYLDGKKYFTYKVVSLGETSGQFVMTDTSGDSMEMKATKVY